MTVGRLVVGSVVLLLAGCADDRADRSIMRVDVVANDGRTLWVAVASCNGNPGIEVDQSATQVVLRARGGTTNNDCGDIVCVQLEEPLGERAVLDGTTGEPVAVSETGDVFGECT
jgi:hypothetical protein